MMHATPDDQTAFPKREYVLGTWGDYQVYLHWSLLLWIPVLVLYFTTPFGERVLSTAIAILCVVTLNQTLQAAIAHVLGLEPRDRRVGVFAIGVKWHTIPDFLEALSKEERKWYALLRMLAAAGNILVAAGIYILGWQEPVLVDIQYASLFFGLYAFLPLHGLGEDTLVAVFSLALPKLSAYRIAGLLALGCGIAAGWYISRYGHTDNHIADLGIPFALTGAYLLYKSFDVPEEAEHAGRQQGGSAQQ